MVHLFLVLTVVIIICPACPKVMKHVCFKYLS